MATGLVGGERGGYIELVRKHVGFSLRPWFLFPYIKHYLSIYFNRDLKNRHEMIIAICIHYEFSTYTVFVYSSDAVAEEDRFVLNVQS